MSPEEKTRIHEEVEEVPENVAVGFKRSAWTLLRDDTVQVGIGGRLLACHSPHHESCDADVAAEVLNESGAGTAGAEWRQEECS
jgi:hypothetical protein